MTPKTYEDGLRAALTACRAIEAKAITVGALEEIAAETAASDCADAIKALIHAQPAREPLPQVLTVARLQRILEVERGLNPPEGWARMGWAWYHAATTTWVRAEDQATIRWAWWRYGEDDSTIIARGSADTALEAIEDAQAHFAAGA